MKTASIGLGVWISLLAMSMGADAHTGAGIEVRSVDWDHSQYWREAEKLSVSGHISLRNRTQSAEHVVCEVILRLRSVEDPSQARAKPVAKRVQLWVRGQSDQYKEWHTLIPNPDGRWRLAREARVAHCHMR
jgi:hypothetical protein